MRALMLTVLGTGLAWLFQSLDLVGIAREFGFPVVVAGVMFFYFSREIRKKDGDLISYREAVLTEQQSQTDFLKELLSEAKQANYCHVKEVDICKFER